MRSAESLFYIAIAAAVLAIGAVGLHDAVEKSRHGSAMSRARDLGVLFFTEDRWSGFVTWRQRACRSVGEGPAALKLSEVELEEALITSSVSDAEIEQVRPLSSFEVWTVQLPRQPDHDQDRGCCMAGRHLRFSTRRARWPGLGRHGGSLLGVVSASVGERLAL